MKYTVDGFRPLYHNFCIFPLEGNIKRAAHSIPGFEGADGVLAYGYCDDKTGFTIDIMCCVKKAGERTYAMGLEPVGRHVRLKIDMVKDLEFTFFAYGESPAKERFKQRIEDLSVFKASADVEESRKCDFLDHFRSQDFIDNVTVELIKEGFDSQQCQVRIIGLGDKCFIGILLDEPNSYFGYNKGDTIAFFYNKDKRTGEETLVCNMEDVKKITEEELKDGSVLSAAIKAFNADKSKEKYYAVLEIIRDSKLWVPYNGSESDILMSGEKFYFPAFTSEEAMGEYGENFTKVRKSALEIIALAKVNDKKLSGIVIDAFSDVFLVNSDIFDMVGRMKSRL